MCSTTPKTKSGNPAVKTPAVIKKPPTLPAIKSLQSFLSDEYNNVEKTNLEPASPVINGFTVGDTHMAISIRALDTNKENQYGEINGTTMHFSASMIKVACMYAAFDLRSAARAFANNNSFSNTNDFQSAFTAAIDTSAAIQRLKDFGKGLKPDLSKLLAGFKPTAPNRVDFTPTFANNMWEMIVNSSDSLAGVCIRTVGYSWINVSLMKGNFFDPNTLNGIWLAGDYTGETVMKSVRVPVSNDTVPGGSGQATTTKEMSRLFQLIHTNTALPHVSDAAERAEANTGMHDLIQQAPWWFENDNATVHITETPAFTRDCAKIGVAALGKSGEGGPEVISLGNVVLWKSNAQIGAFNTKYNRELTGEFAICWQNMYKPASHFDALVRLMNNSIEKFLTQ